MNLITLKYISIVGNKMADSLAKSATSFLSNLGISKIPSSNLISYFRKSIVHRRIYGPLIIILLNNTNQLFRLSHDLDFLTPSFRNPTLCPFLD